jgi:sporulation protein YabP
MDMASETIQLPHKLSLNERKNLTMTGVTEVVSFDDTMVVLRTALGTLEVQGQELQLKTLSIDGGQVAVDGHISALLYEEPRNSGGGLFGRLFR